MKAYIDKISELIKSKGFRYEIHSFDSGAFMVDIWTNNDFYCIQLFDNKFGISQITEQIDFSTVPDNTFDLWNDFEFKFKKILEK